MDGLTHEAPNFAPLQPLQRQKRQPLERRVELVEFLKELREEMRREKDSEEWRARRLASQKNELFYRGYQDLRRAELTNSWRVLDPKPVLFIDNEFQFWVNVNVAKWLNSRVDFRVRGLNDSPDAAAAASKVEQMARYYDDRDWTRSEIGKAAKQCQFEGALVAYVYYDPGYSPRKAFRPVTERKTLKLGQDAYRCVDCGLTGQVEDATKAQCEHCGSEQVAVTTVPPVEMDVPTGEQEAYPSGDVCHRLISLYNITWKARLGLKNSDVVLWEEKYGKEELEATYEGLEIPSAGSEDEALQAKAALQNAGRSRDDKSGHVLTRMWIEPNRYKNVVLKEQIETVSGTIIPAGTKLHALSAEGLHVIMLGDLIVDLYPAVKNEDLVSMDYHSMPNGLPQGVDAMCEPQRSKNVANSLMQLWLRHQAAPPLTFVEGVVDPGDLSGDLTQPIPIKAENLGLFPGVTPENAVRYQQGTSLQPGVFAILDRMRAAIQFAAHATEFSEGLPNVNNDTLGGARIAQGMAQAIYGVHLAQWSDFRARIIELTLKKVRRYCWDEKYIDFGGEYGVLEGQFLSGMDIPDDFQIETVPNSWLPRTPEQQQQNFQSLLAALGGPAGVMAAPPALLAHMCEVFDVRFSENHYPAALRTVRDRLKQAAQLLPALQAAQTLREAETGLPPLQMGVDEATGMPVMEPIPMGALLMQGLQPPFNPREAGLDIAAEYLSQWLLTDAGREAPPEVIEFAGILQNSCIEGFQMQQMVRSGVAMAGMPPVPTNGAGTPPAPNSSAAAAMPVGG